MKHFDIFHMKANNFDKNKEQKKLQKEESAKTFKYRKLRGLYGTRPTSQILKGIMDDDDDNSVLSQHRQINVNGIPKNKLKTCSAKHTTESQESEEEIVAEKIPLKERIIIRHDAGWKSVFDVVILLLVGYSCITSLYYVAFISPVNFFHVLFDWIVEAAFYTDLLMNFITEYVDPTSRKPVREIKDIAINYMTGWFIIDILSVFPFNSFMETGPGTKLFRLFRVPRLLKLLDVNRFSSILKTIRGDELTDT